MPPPGRGQLAPGEAQLGATARLFLAREAVQQIELVGGPREPALLELA